MTRPGVSVLIPCFRSARFVERALASLFAQTLATWEAVVVDNASDDATFARVSECAARDPRVRVERNDTNLGPVRNWRRCAELARADKAALLFADDWYEPTFLAETVSRLDDPRVGFVLTAARVSRCGANGTPNLLRGVSIRPLEKSGVYPTRAYLEDVYYLRLRMPVTPACALMRTRDLVRWLAADIPDPTGVDFLSHGAGPDLNLYLNACLAYPCFAYVAEPQVVLLSHDANLSKSKNARSAYAMALKEFFTAHAPPDLDPARVWAGLWWRLRRDARRRSLLPKLGPRGGLAVARLAFTRGAARLRGHG